MISKTLTKMFIGGGFSGPVINIGTQSYIKVVLMTIIIAIIDLLIRGLILEYGYNLLVKKLKLDWKKLNLIECLIIIILVMCLFRN